jgi:glucuronate isomerase
MTGCLSPETAESIWNECNEKLAQPEFSARGIMKQMNVVLVCTTDDPISDLSAHKKIVEDKSFDIKVLPTWRPDKAMMIEWGEEFNKYIDKLGAAAGIEIKSCDDLLVALRKRQDFFASMGCKLSDHGIDMPYAEDYTMSEISAIFKKARSNNSVSLDEVKKYKSWILYEFGVMNWEKGWVQQFHIGAMRNNNTRLFKLAGADIGCDSIGDAQIAYPLSRYLDRLDQKNQLTKTILYNLNPAHNEVIATMIGNFQDGSVPGKIQMGSGWWFLDQLDGMTRQIEALSQMGC